MAVFSAATFCDFRKLQSGQSTHRDVSFHSKPTETLQRKRPCRQVLAFSFLSPDNRRVNTEQYARVTKMSEKKLP